MKRMFAVILILPLMLAGCAQGTAPTPPLAPGYTNQADKTMGQTLAAADAFYRRIQQDSAAGTVALSAQEKTVLNDLGVALNIANVSYLAYHNGTQTQAQAQDAINQVTAKQTAAEALGVK